MQINSITSLPKIAEVPGSSKINEANGVSFGDFLQNAINERGCIFQRNLRIGGCDVASFAVRYQM